MPCHFWNEKTAAHFLAKARIVPGRIFQICVLARTLFGAADIGVPGGAVT
jgi:hypothetical protein